VRTRPGLAVVATLAVLALSGCGSGVRLRGRVVADGQPVTVPDGTALTLTFTEAADGEQAGHSYAALVDPDGAFTCEGPPGAGLPPGRYKVMVSSTATDPAVAAAALKRFPGVSDPKTTPLTYEVNGEREQQIVIDLGKRTVRREP
jgi:hypothetical protein